MCVWWRRHRSHPYPSTWVRYSRRPCQRLGSTHFLVSLYGTHSLHDACNIFRAECDTPPLPLHVAGRRVFTSSSKRFLFPHRILHIASGCTKRRAKRNSKLSKNGIVLLTTPVTSSFRTSRLVRRKAAVDDGPNKATSQPRCAWG